MFYWLLVVHWKIFFILDNINFLAKKSDEGLPNMIRVIKRSYSADEYPGEESHDNVAIVSLNIDIYFIKSSINFLDILYWNGIIQLHQSVLEFAFDRRPGNLPLCTLVVVEKYTAIQEKRKCANGVPHDQTYATSKWCKYHEAWKD